MVAYFHVMAHVLALAQTVDVAPVRIDLPEILLKKVPGFITECPIARRLGKTKTRDQTQNGKK